MSPLLTLCSRVVRSLANINAEAISQASNLQKKTAKYTEKVDRDLVGDTPHVSAYFLSENDLLNANKIHIVVEYRLITSYNMITDILRVLFDRLLYSN